MREALNSNPMVQMAVIAVLLVVAALVMLTGGLGGGGGSDEAPPAESAVPATAGAGGASGTPAAGTSSSAPATAPSPGGPTVGGPGSPVTPAPESSGSVTPEALKPGKGLPRPVVDAWNDGQAIVLLIVRGGGIDDRLVRGALRRLSSEPGATVFVARAKAVARYSRITEPVGVNRAPALVVVRPKRITGAIPQAQVSYGFRDSQSVFQAYRDAVYEGRDNVPYHPG